MTRKGTIIIAVLVNACLLIMLFITATTSEEELLLESTTVMHPPSIRQEVALQKPLFDEPTEKVVQESQKLPLVDTPPVSPSIQEKTVIVQSSESVTHKLPKIKGAKPEKKPEKKIVVAQSKPAVKKKTVAAPAPSFKKITVKKGDTLEKIAKRHGSTVKKIVAFNHLPSTFLRIGQILNIPNGSKETVAAKPALQAQGAYYVVKSGDNPWTIAMKHHMKVNDLLKLNHLDEKKAKRLKPGDRLRIR